MIDIFSLILGFILGYFIGLLSIYFWIKRYINKVLKEGMALERLIKIVQEGKK